MPADRTAAYDEIVVEVFGGRGGDGCIAFHREKYVPKGGPSGGDGGQGGDVILVAKDDIHGFAGFRGRKKLRAKNGAPGRGRNRHGKNAQDLIVRVPVGTEVRDADTDVLLKDLTERDAQVRMAKGGGGGRGNARFARATRQTPRMCEDGRDGESRRLRLSMKLIADVGLVGLPNAGKSTLLAALSRSRTQAGAHRFTTLNPHLGVVDLDAATRVVFADLPGLIAGAHEGKGLGDRFLKHVERTRLLVHVVAHDPTGGSPAPGDAYRTVRGELEAYSADLASKPELIVLSKCDLTGWEEALNSLAPNPDSQVYPISAVTGLGLDRLVKRVAALLDPDAEF